jgi:hypothetical protein
MIVDPHFVHFAKRESGRLMQLLRRANRERETAQRFHKSFLLANEFERLSVAACHLFLMDLEQAIV